MIVFIVISSLAAQDEIRNTTANKAVLVNQKIEQQAVELKQQQYAIGEKLLNEYPNDFHALRIMGYIHSSHGNLTKMAECWQKCREIEPNRADIYDQLGRYFLRVENYEEAIRSWAKVLKLDSQFPGVYERIGSALILLGKLESAKTALQRQLKITKNSSEAHYLLGEVCFQLQQFQQAKENYLSAVRLQSHHAKAYYGLVKTCARLGQDDETQKFAAVFQKLENAAIEADRQLRQEFDDLQQMKGKVANTLVDAGKLYQAKGRLTEAAELWSRSTWIDPTNPAGFQLLASYYGKTRNPKGAAEQYACLIKLEPTNLQYREKLGFLQAGLRDTKSAEATFKTMIEIAPQKPNGYRALAKFYLNTKQQPKTCLRLAATAMKLQATADGFFVLGWAYAVNGETEKAQQALERAVKMAPKIEHYRQLLASVKKASSK